MIRIGEIVRGARMRAGISQAELSRISGVAQATISAIEADGQTRSPSLDTVEKIAVALGYTLSEFLIDEKSPPSDDDGLRREIAILLNTLSPDDLRQMIEYAVFLKSRRGG